MRKVLITLAAAGSALAIATPAAAQYFPVQQPYGYGHQGYYQGYNQIGHIRALQARIDRVQANINRLDSRDVIRERTARNLRQEARSAERRLRQAAGRGLNPWESNEMERRVFRLEQRVRTAMGRGWRHDYGVAGYNGYTANGDYNRYYADRDRDGRNDRWEDDQGRDRDGDGHRGNRDD
jgi:hypothetical protein